MPVLAGFLGAFGTSLLALGHSEPYIPALWAYAIISRHDAAKCFGNEFAVAPRGFACFSVRFFVDTPRADGHNPITILLASRGHETTVLDKEFVIGFGGMPERLKGTDCKSVGYAYVGSNPTPSTIDLETKTLEANFDGRGGCSSMVEQ